MLEIDCRTCGNCDMDRGCCKLYGDDPQKAVKACADNGFRNYCPRSSEKLINGRTAEEIKHVLEWVDFDCCGIECDNCSYQDVCSHENSDRVVSDTLALIERLESERDAALAKVPRWISVKERLPELYQHVIVHVQHTEKWRRDTPKEDCWQVVEEDCWLGDGWDINADSDIHEITHWMPLPEPPKDSPQNEGRA